MKFWWSRKEDKVEEKQEEKKEAPKVWLPIYKVETTEKKHMMKKYVWAVKTDLDTYLVETEDQVYKNYDRYDLGPGIREVYPHKYYTYTLDVQNEYDKKFIVSLTTDYIDETMNYVVKGSPRNENNQNSYTFTLNDSNGKTISLNGKDIYSVELIETIDMEEVILKTHNKIKLEGSVCLA